MTRLRAVKISNPLESIGVSNPADVEMDFSQNVIQSKNGVADLDLDQLPILPGNGSHAAHKGRGTADCGEYCEATGAVA